MTGTLPGDPHIVDYSETLLSEAKERRKGDLGLASDLLRARDSEALFEPPIAPELAMAQRRWHNAFARSDFASLMGVMVVLFAALLLASAAQSAPSRFDLSQIGFTQKCEPNATFKRLIGVMAGRGESRSSADLSVLNAVSGDTSHSLTLDEPIQWKGLRLRGVELEFGIERGPANYGLVFDEPPERAIAVLNRHGFRLAAPNKTRDVQGLENYARTGVSRHGTGSALWCARD